MLTKAMLQPLSRLMILTVAMWMHASEGDVRLEVGDWNPMRFQRPCRRRSP